MFADTIGTSHPTLEEINKDCCECCTPDVHVGTLRRWWYDYEEWGELPHRVAVRKRRLKAWNKGAPRNQVLNDGDVQVIKRIVDDNPNLYLDEIAFQFGMELGKFVHHSTIRRCLIDRLGYSMKVLQNIASQQCELNETRFLEAMGLYLHGFPDRLITIDETHRDRNAARRRRGWGKKGNGGGVTVRAWFENVVRYTLIAPADINGFIPCACHTVLRDEVSDEGAAGTVDGEYFLHWVKNYLCPVLGSYELGENRSVVLMDNASTHMSDEVEYAIAATGAILVYGAPYSPHLNPIELYFAQYKSYLKRNDRRMLYDWYSVHTDALNVVDRDMGIKFFRKSKVPGSYLVSTSDELFR